MTSALRTAWLLVRLRARRQMNLLGTVLLRRKGKKRTGTGKAGGGWGFALLIGVAMAFSFGVIAFQIVETMQATVPIHLIRRAFGLEAMLIGVASLLVMVGSRELARGDWDLEWLATLPVGLRTLLLTRAVERAVVNPNGLLLLLPFLFFVAGWRELSAEAALAALAVGLPLLLVLGAAHLVIDAGLRLRFSAARLRNLQALLSILGIVAVYMALSPGISKTNPLVGPWTAALPSAFDWTPFGLAAKVAGDARYRFPFGTYALLVVEAAAIIAAAVLYVARELRYGVVASSERDSGRVRRPPAAIAAGEGGSRLGPVARRELKLLARDRSFVVQTLVLPAVIIGAQLFFNESLVLASLVENPTRVSALAFGIATYSLMFSAFQTLNAEGQALWILFSVPRPLSRILRDKALLWGSLALVFPCGVYLAYLGAGGEPSWALLGLAATVLAGIPIYTTIAVSLGVFACNPLSQDVQRRVKTSYVYLFMLLGSAYGYTLVSATVWQTLGMLTLTACLALALWQKASDYLPYLLDPTDAPPARVSLSDGLIAVMGYFVVQMIALVALMGSKPAALGTDDLALASAIAGFVAYLGVRLTFWRTKAQDVPRYFSGETPRALAWGAGTGLVAGAIGMAYQTLARQQGWLPADAVAPRDLSFYAFVLIVAPVAEEFLFRGLVYRGLRRSRGLAFSVVASSAVFAIVHPPAAVAPVFVLGLLAAFAYARSGLLIAPVVAHLLYNAAVTLPQSTKVSSIPARETAANP